MANWITTQEVKDSTLIQQNVADFLFENDIEYAQETKIEPCLGEDLVDRINLELSTTVSTEIQKLLDDFIKPAQELWTFYLAVPNMGTKFTNKGIFKKADEVNVPATVEDVEYIRRPYRNRAEFKTNKLIKFLVANPDDYPEYLKCKNKCGDKNGFTFRMDYVKKANVKNINTVNQVEK